MQKLIDYRDETPEDKDKHIDDVLIVFRVEDNKITKKYGVWCTKEMACDKQILEPFLLQSAKMINNYPESVNSARAYCLKSK